MEKKRKKCEKLKSVLLFRHFTLKIFNGGVFLPITTTPKYRTTVPNSVNDTQDFMCIKFKALLPCKHHPNVKASLRKTCLKFATLSQNLALLYHRYSPLIKSVLQCSCQAQIPKS